MDSEGSRQFSLTSSCIRSPALPLLRLAGAVPNMLPEFATHLFSAQVKVETGAVSALAPSAHVKVAGPEAV